MTVGAGNGVASFAAQALIVDDHLMRRLVALILCLGLSILCLGVLSVGTASAAKPKSAKSKPVPYGPEAEQVLDIYKASTPDSPVCVTVHGGAWVSKSLVSFRHEAEELQPYCAVFNIDYRLASATVPAFPMQVEDVEAATRYAMAHATEENGDPANIIEIGTSAGGQLAAITTDRMDAATPGTVAGTVTLSGPMDFTTLLAAARVKGFSKAFASQMEEALGCSLDTTCETPEAEALAVEFSPADQVPPTCPGAWRVFNSAEELIPLDQPEAIDAALEAEECSVETTILPNNKHAKEYWETVAGEVFSFVASH